MANPQNFPCVLYDDLEPRQQEQAKRMFIDAHQAGNRAAYSVDRDGNVVSRRVAPRAHGQRREINSR